jgi:hypothetical protein
MQQPADVVVRPAIKHVRRSVVRDAHEIKSMPSIFTPANFVTV